MATALLGFLQKKNCILKIVNFCNTAAAVMKKLAFYGVFYYKTFMIHCFDLEGNWQHYHRAYTECKFFYYYHSDYKVA